MSKSIFSNENDESPVQVIRKTMSVSVSDAGEPTVTFAMNRGKGTGAQSMPVEQFREYVETLVGYVEDGVPEDQVYEVLTAAECLRRSIRNDDGVLSFRTRNGKGAKPAKISSDSLESVANLLLSTIEAVENAGASLAAPADQG